MASALKLSRRALNRALLARQMLLEREKISPLAAIERLVAMQAQIPRPPFVGLWTRLQQFKPEELRRLLQERKAVRATAMRGTIHLMSTKDFLAFRPVLAEALARGAQSIVGKRLGQSDVGALNELGRTFFGKSPATFDAFRKWLEKEHPKLDARAVAYTARLGVPLVMVPTEAPWSFAASADFTLADCWLDSKALTKLASIETLVTRYLAGFGPATPTDFQTWSGIRGAREVFEKLRPKLATFRDEGNRELFDLADAPRPGEDTPAPIRFLPEFDNALLAHEDRTRIIANEHRPMVFLKNLTIVGTFLVDGFVAGAWKLERAKKSATLKLNPFVKIPKKTLAGVEEEGQALLGFIEPEVGQRDISMS